MKIPARSPGMSRRVREAGSCRILVATLLLLAAVPVAATGCASTSTASQANARPSYLEDYTSGNYSAALVGASAAARNTKNSEGVREQATLIAGEAAHALDRNAEAKTWLFKISGSNNQAVRGKAQATLGLIELEDGNMSRAADLLSSAAADLSGDEAGRSALYAGDAFRASSRESEAIKSYQKAMELSRSDSTLRADVKERLAGKPGPSGPVDLARTPIESSKPPFTLQLAAFSSPQKAGQHVAKVRSESIRLAMGVPHVVPVFRGGKILYSVRVGTFAARMDADRAKARFKGAMVISISG
jgi:tetratricopeptide (TPR) repeat protein